MSFQTIARKPHPLSRHKPSPLPYDLLLLLISELVSTSSLATLAKLQRCCKSYYALITPLIYKSVHIHSDDQLQRFLFIEGGKKGRKAAKSISFTMTPTSSTTTGNANANGTSNAGAVVGGRSRAHSVGSVVRGLGLESPKQLEKRRKKEEAQLKVYGERVVASAGTSPLVSPSTSQLDLTLSSNNNNGNETNGGGGGGLQYTKSEAFFLVDSLTLDIYPSRTSLKLASKISTPVRPALPRTSKLIITSLALQSLHDKLKLSQAPRIIAEYWASHASELLRPKNVSVDYSMFPNQNHNVDFSEPGWMDTMWGISAMVQQYGPIDLTLKGEVWTSILPAPGAKVRMEHTNKIHSIPQTSPGGTQQLPAPAPQVLQVPPAPLAPGALGAAPAPTPAPVDPQTAARTQLIKDRREALTLGLRSTFTINEQASARAGSHSIPLRWEIIDFFPPRLTSNISSAASIMTHDTLLMEEEERERDDVMRALLLDLDTNCPELVKRYKREVDGKRTLGCVVWSESVV